MSKKWLNWFVVSLLILLILSGCNKGNASLSVSEEPEINEEEIEEEYREKMHDVTEVIYSSSSPIATMILEYNKLWELSIKQDLEVQKLANVFKIDYSALKSYLPENKTYKIMQGDINTTLNLIKEVRTDDGTIGELEEYREEIRSAMNDLKNPPTKYEEVYKEVVEFYSIFERFIDLGIFPTGNYSSYSENANDTSTEFENQYQKLQVLLP